MLWMVKYVANETSSYAKASKTAALALLDKPVPPFSSWQYKAPNPISAAVLKVSIGKYFLLSHSAACGASSSDANFDASGTDYAASDADLDAPAASFGASDTDSDASDADFDVMIPMLPSTPLMMLSP